MASSPTLLPPSSSLVPEESLILHDSLSESDKESDVSRTEKGKSIEGFSDEAFAGELDYYEGVLSSSDESLSKAFSDLKRRRQFDPSCALKSVILGEKGQDTVGRRSERLHLKALSGKNSKYLANGNDFVYDKG